MTGAETAAAGRPGALAMRLAHAAVIVGLTALLTAGVAPTAVAEPRATSTRGAATAPTESGDPMPGMDMPEHDTAPEHAPAQEPPAHDMEGMTTPAEDLPGAVDEHTGAVARPRGLVLGTFAAVNAAVLLSAALVRRRTKHDPDRRRAARLAAPATA
ncbi:hypothetical protein [Pengzhenrongella frigida]|uniref:Uncharacterized protein n=1 Tax=Pengzhenrongella frigida TaxID=1259133 RepID=A0A4Q5N202_9MICO|nr:hypothetical protein [Cellulomonas sp. HLT2-17]RYV52150.1 hypothetical protein EUA98_05160 [Cellulomonas sp. HLT2-17]